MSSLPFLRQSAAELLASVIIDLFPGAVLVQSISTEMGFYCDIIATQPIDEYALPLIEEKMRGLVKQNLEVKTLEMMREVAANFLEHKGQPIRSDEVRNARENIVSLIQIGNFTDYCALPYITETQEVESFKILKIEKANHFLQDEGLVEVKRVHGIVSTDKQSLKKLVKALKAGEKADHTKMTEFMKFFSFREELSDLSWTWESNGLLLKKNLINWWEKEHQEQQFSLVATPSLVKESLLKKTGISANELEDSDLLPLEFEETSYVIPSTLTPSHIVLFQEKNRSLREMPIRYAECASLVSTKKRGKLWGVLDARLISADFAHIFCAPEHLEREMISSLQFIDKIIKIFGFEYYWYFTGRGQKFAGTERRWEKAVETIDSAFEKCGFSYTNHPHPDAFEGPIIEARLIDRFGREWNGPTVSLDFNSPAKFGLSYQASDGKTQIPLMIVRSVFSSLERFIALLIEQNLGLLPLWIVPKQVVVLSVKEDDEAYATKISQTIRNAGYRVETEFGQELIGKKITKAENEKVPYVVIVGENEEKENTVTWRSVGSEVHQQTTSVEAFLKMIDEQVLLKAPR